jgi:hypothetical protein
LRRRQRPSDRTDDRLDHGERDHDGDDAPAGYTAVLDGTTSRAVDADGSVNFTSVSSGTHSVELTEVPANCTVTSANPAHAPLTILAGPNEPTPPLPGSGVRKIRALDFQNSFGD